jgi:hypothetical protein
LNPNQIRARYTMSMSQNKDSPVNVLVSQDILIAGILKR